MGPAQINGYYNPQQNRIGMWGFPVRAFYSWYHFPRSFKMSNVIYLIRLYLIIMKTKTKNINKQKKEEKRFN